MSLVDARRALMNLLARREHSQQEIRQKLSRKGFEITDIEDALSASVANGLQSDVRFCEAYIRMRLHQGFGPRRIQCELLTRGVSDELIGKALAEQADAFQESLKTVIQKKFPVPAKDFASKAKQMRFLQYRGFDVDSLKQTIDDTGS